MSVTNKKKLAIAERMFIEDGETAKYIAQFLELTEQTISRWRKKGNWDDRRAENLTAPHKIKALLQKQLVKIANGEKSEIDADALSKISRVLQDVTSKTSVQVTMSVLKEFDIWMNSQDAELGLSFLRWHKKFIMHKASLE